MKITGPIMVWAVISGFYAAARQGFGVFFPLHSIPHGSMIASSGGLIRHYGGLYSLVNTRHRGKFCLITLWGWMVAGEYCN